jgi:subtilisin-like proprotein convertase family protein
MESFEPILVNRTITLEFGGGMKLIKSETFLSAWEQNPLMGNYSNLGGMSSGIAEFIPLIEQFKNSGFEFSQTPFSNSEFATTKQLTPSDDSQSNDAVFDPLSGDFSENQSVKSLEIDEITKDSKFPIFTSDFPITTDLLTNNNNFSSITNNLQVSPEIVLPTESLFPPNLTIPPILIPPLALPDLVVTSLETRGAAFIRDDKVILPIAVGVKNEGNASADPFKVSLEYTKPGNSTPFVVAFTANNNNNVNPDTGWYPFTRNPLVAGSEVTFTGELIFGDRSLLGQPISLNAIADSTSGDEFIPESGRVRESNENNNRSTTLNLSLNTSLPTNNLVNNLKLSDTLKSAIERASDLNNYDPKQLAETRQWVVNFSGNQSPDKLAANLGVKNIQPTGYLPDTYIWEFSDNLTPADVAKEMQSLTGVNFFYPLVGEQAEPDFIPNDPLFTNQWHLQNTGATGGTPGADAKVTTAWDFAKGTGVVIGIVDDSLQYTHPDLNPQYRADLSFDFNDRDRDPAPVSGDDYHGTPVAGIAAARGNNGVGVSGAAPEAQLAGLRMLAGPSTDLMRANALSYQRQEIDIYNNSWSPTNRLDLRGPNPLTLAALQEGVTLGRGGLGNIYIFSAGNNRVPRGTSSGFDNVNYNGYANSRYTIAVGAIDHKGVASSYSEPGAPVLVSAFSQGNDGPGTTTTDLLGPNGYNGLSNLDYTNRFGGTSSAAPLVSGVVALMLEANPNLTWRDVQHILVKTSRQTDTFDSDWVINGGGNWVNHKYGFGSIDATSAVNAAKNWTTVASEVSTTSGTIATSTAIPDNNPTGITSTASISDDIKIEWAEIVFDADHTARGDLEVVLVSPNGTESILAEQRPDLGDNYDNWVFTSARHWDESSVGNWTLKVTDKATGNTGTWNSWKLNLYGTAKDEVIVTPPQIDLVGQSFDVNPEPLNAGNSFQVNYQIQNRGSGNAGRFSVDFYLSTDGVINTNDKKLGTAEVTGVAGNSNTGILRQNLRLPDVWEGADFWSAIADGTYHIGMIVDSTNAIAETNEANNRNTGEFRDFDRVQINNTLPLVNIPLPEIFQFRPLHTRGDREFDGNGPDVVSRTNLTSSGSFLNLSSNATFTETKSDWTTFGGSTSRSVNVGALYPGWRIDSIVSPTSDTLSYRDTNHSLDIFNRGTTGLARRYEFQGDRNGGLFGGADDPWVSIAFNPARIRLRRV